VHLPWRKADAAVSCPGCKRDDRFVLVAQFHSITTALVVRVEAVRLACESCHGQWDLKRSGEAVEIRPARLEAAPAAREEQPGSDDDRSPTDTDLKGLYSRRK